MLDRWFIHEDPDDNPIYVKYVVPNDLKAYYTMMLDLHAEEEQHPIPKGSMMLLRLLISWIPKPDLDPFVITHPDFDIQNFRVSEEGELRSAIDWDGVATMPRTLSNQRYPGWLKRDWDPSIYRYKEFI
ncbi:hypothetical protein N7495_001940 [Penicillium taxi]|uniref:uncharacterized protein n=1 Tax=Penicillium taxi TaxID=168475 RepID=UPI002545419D|nr:uncharacterized protein N7495_001940 [Penicillium taxi]KAJ5909258.1 hypothetical protein N7495_001940 [Penicillium taxi]